MSPAGTLAPLCRYCGKAIAKTTRIVWFGQQERRDDQFSDSRTERPASKEEAQRLLNKRIVALRFSPDRTFVHRVSTWNGESYADEFFCTNEHARLFGYAAARTSPTLATEAYHAAVTTRR